MVPRGGRRLLACGPLLFPGSSPACTLGVCCGVCSPQPPGLLLVLLTPHHALLGTAACSARWAGLQGRAAPGVSSVLLSFPCRCLQTAAGYKGLRVLFSELPPSGIFLLILFSMSLLPRSSLTDPQLLDLGWQVREPG